MIVETIPEIAKLSAKDRYILANELWDQVASDETSIPFDDAVGELLESRKAEYDVDPSAVVSWEDATKKLLGR